MDLERCSVGSSNSLTSSSSPSSSASSSSFSSGLAAAAAAAAADRMVRIELEAAEALADLAHLAMRESGSGDSSGKWGRKGKRGKKQVKSESPPVDSVSNLVIDSVPNCPVLASQDQAVANQQHGESICKNVVLNFAKTELDADLRKPSPNCVKSHPSYSVSRLRQNLTEAEKEARRLRRILANRESARQTIRRRQALYEELTRKAADLAWEQENLKRDKELALKEYQSLESKNKHLKAKMAKLIKTEVEESSGDPKSTDIEKPTALTTNCSMLLYNQHPFSALCWPSIVQPANTVHLHHGPPNPTIVQSSNPIHSHHVPQNAIAIPTNISIPPNGELDLSQQQQENTMIVNGPRAPLYIVSCPWFFSVPDNGNGIHPNPSFGLKHVQDGTSVNNQCSSSSSSKVVTLVDNQLSSLPKKVKSEAAGSTEVRIIDDLNETLVGFPPGGGGQCTGMPPEETPSSLVPLSSVIPTVAVKNENGPQLVVSHTGGICLKPRQLISALRGKNQDPFKFPNKKLVDAAAAAEARRRRKELTKLKSLHTRHCRMNC